MDAFQVRMDFQALLKKLNASQQSIEKVLSFADRHVAKASADLWDCLLNECAKTNLSSRLNILFLLDFLFMDYSSRYSQRLINDFRRMTSKDLDSLIHHIVPHDSLNGIKLNSGVTIQLLTSWRLKRLFPQDQITDVLAGLQERIANVLQAGKDDAGMREDQPGWEGPSSSSSSSSLSHAEILRRIEEDRERHKRIRERMWVLPPKSFFDAVPDPSSSKQQLQLLQQHQHQQQQTQHSAGDSERIAKRPKLDSTPAEMNTGAGEIEEEGDQAGPLPHADPMDIQFEELWETTSDLNQDDLESWREEEDQRWWGSEEQIKRREAERVVQLHQEREAETERKRLAYEVERQRETQRLQEEERKDAISGGDRGQRLGRIHSSGLAHSQPRTTAPVDPMGPPPPHRVFTVDENEHYPGEAPTVGRPPLAPPPPPPLPPLPHPLSGPPSNQDATNDPEPSHQRWLGQQNATPQGRMQAWTSSPHRSSNLGRTSQPPTPQPHPSPRWGSRGNYHNVRPTRPTGGGAGAGAGYQRRWGNDAPSR